MPEPEVVNVLSPGCSGLWEPVIGETTAGLEEWLLQHRKLPDPEAFARVRSSALQILRGCHPFSVGDGSRTGLVVGYVQSGKTMSMTTVSALARDNNCRLIIFLAGVTKNLLDQSVARLTEQLRGASGGDGWKISSSSRLRVEQDAVTLNAALAEWRDTAIAAEDQQTFLYLVLKNHNHLKKVHRLLETADLRGIPALIFDDEADQASLNTTPDEPDASTTYRWIAKIRDALPSHTYLQYTATPQAPLLIQLDDMLSPDFAEVVDAGTGYTGGLTFFGEGQSPHVRVLPSDELFGAGRVPSDVPSGLLKAMREFFVGCAVARLRGGPTPRSMLIHPSQRTSDQGVFLKWATSAANSWASMIKREGSDEKTDLLLEMRAAYDDLATTDGDLPPFEDLEKHLRLALGRVSLKQVNSDDGTEIDWEDAQEHILVGGEKLNRGFTIEGLTVTYMPRGPGGSNADTIQQRARFFGYKKGYAGLCRIYLHPQVRDAYRDYVMHEEDIRKQLREHQGRPLSEWRRAFFLSRKLQPSRRNVISTFFDRRLRSQSWYASGRPHDAPIELNRKRVDAFLANVVTDPEAQEGYFHHEVSRVRLADAFEGLVLPYKPGVSDSPTFTSAQLWISDILDRDPEAEAILVQMRKSASELVRERSGSDFKLFQGRSSSKKEGKYPGDDKLCDAVLVTFQVHWVDIAHGPARVPALAIHIPAALMRDDVLVQL